MIKNNILKIYAFFRKLLTFLNKRDIINYVEVLAESELTQCTKTEEILKVSF